MRPLVAPLGGVLLAALVFGPAGRGLPDGAVSAQAPQASVEDPPRAALTPQARAAARYQDDLAAVRTHRPAYPFWQHIFTIPDGSIIFGSAADGRLLARFPTGGNWAREAVWMDRGLNDALSGIRLGSRLSDRRDQVEEALAPIVGAVVHNPTRGRFLSPHAERYGRFLAEWGAIYERFAVPGEIGLAQAIVESGLNGRARSRAQALGFCQWLRRNWNYLDRLAPHVLEAYNQTTQAPYCAAHLTILATMYGSFIPALSEHHAGGVNVGRAVINGERLGGADGREQYLIGAEFARDLRNISIQRYRDLFRTYGPRSFLYAEMVFGNTINVERLRDQTPQTEIFAMRAPRDIPLTEVASTTGLSADEVKRFNPALIRRVPARANLYLPRYVPEFGDDVTFWRRPASQAFDTVLGEFLELEPGVARWHEASFQTTLQGFERRFLDTGTEEGVVMATTLAYIISDLRTSRRAQILEEFRSSGRILRLFQQGLGELRASLAR